MQILKNLSYKTLAIWAGNLNLLHPPETQFGSNYSFEFYAGDMADSFKNWSVSTFMSIYVCDIFLPLDGIIKVDL